MGYRNGVGHQEAPTKVFNSFQMASAISILLAIASPCSPGSTTFSHGIFLAPCMLSTSCFARFMYSSFPASSPGSIATTNVPLPSCSLAPGIPARVNHEKSRSY
jgi:hypothetical protein